MTRRDLFIQQIQTCSVTDDHVLEDPSETYFLHLNIIEVFAPILPPSGRLISTFTSLMVKSPLLVFKSESLHSQFLATCFTSAAM